MTKCKSGCQTIIDSTCESCMEWIQDNDIKLIQIEAILDGIDRDEENEGWWPTISGIDFGKKCLESIRDLFEKRG
jgi:hypothetical protein